MAAGSLLSPAQMLLASQYEKSGSAKTGVAARKWAMVVDVDKCTGCDTRICEAACRNENNVPLYDDPELDAYWLRVANVKQDLPGVDSSKSVPLLCQHCENPPCVHVCPVGASFKRDDGIVLVDQHRCIGCRYCMVACPYKARSFIVGPSETWINPKVPKLMHGVVSKCTFCVHRVDAGRLPACVEQCPDQALVFGDMNDTGSEVASLIATGDVKTLRPNLSVGPKVFYLGL